MLNKAGLKHNLLNAKYHEKEAQIVAEAGRFGAITIATNMAGRGTDIMLGGNVQKEIDDEIAKAKEKLDRNIADSEELATNIADIEKIIGSKEDKENKDVKQENNVGSIDALKIADEVREKHKKEYQQVVDAGGLLVIGSERHESRRIDNQLKGRAGRQGDPGQTQFYLSLKDNLLRIFGGEKIDMFLSKIGFKGNEPMNHPMLNSIINKSQKKIENFNYEIRKNLLKYDDIVNEQRKVIYEQRMAIVKSDNISRIFKQIVNDVNEDIIARATHNNEVDVRELKDLMQQTYLFAKSDINLSKYDLETLNTFCIQNYSNSYMNVDLYSLAEVQRRVMLQTLDECWREHLYYLDHIKEGIHLRAYAHKDPFSEYKFESYTLMQKTMNKFIYIVVGRMFNLRIDFNND